MQRMNWEAMSAIAEATGVFAVVVSLIYLATQIRFARVVAADVTRHARAAGVREGAMAVVDNPELRKNWMTAAQIEPAYEVLANELNLGVDGAIQVDFMCLYWAWLHWGQYASIKTPEDLDELEHLVSVFYSVPPMSVCLRTGPYSNNLDKRFLQFVSKAVAKGRHEDVSRSSV